MKLNYTSWNIRGLESSNRKFVVKRFLRMVKELDLLMVQEIKFVVFSLEISLKSIRKDAISFSTSHQRGKGGTSILIGSRWRKYIRGWGCSPCNRALWVAMVYDNIVFGICSIYAPNDYNERIALWKWMTKLANIPRVLAGDFNMIERPQDKSGGLKFEWKGNEQYFWNRMMGKLNLFDPLTGLKDNSKGVWYTV